MRGLTIVVCSLTYDSGNLSSTFDSSALGLGVDRYVFFRADTDYYRSSRPITDILNRYVSGVKMKINAKINNNKSSDKKTFFKCF